MTAMSKSLKRVSVKPGASIYAHGKHARGDLFIVDEGTLELVAKADGKRIRSYQTGDLIGLCEMMADVKGGEDCTDVVANGSAALLALSKKDYVKLARASRLEPWAAAVDDALKTAHADRCAKLLRNVDFFARLSDEELNLLTPLGSFVAAKPGTIALEQGVCDPGLYIVLSGALSVCVKIDNDEMKEHDLAIFRTHAAAEAESLTQKAMQAGVAAEAVEDVRARLVLAAGGSHEKHDAIILQGAGTHAIESVLGSAVGSDQRVLILNNGAYGERQKHICRVLGINFVSDLLLLCLHTVFCI